MAVGQPGFWSRTERLRVPREGPVGVPRQGKRCGYAGTIVQKHAEPQPYGAAPVAVGGQNATASRQKVIGVQPILDGVQGMTIDIVRICDGVQVGTIEVDQDGTIRFQSGQPELASLVDEEFQDGLFMVVDEWGDDGAQYAIPAVATPADPLYEHRLSVFLSTFGLCAASQL